MEGWLNTITIENVHPNTTVAVRMKGISGETGSMKLYAYGADGTLKEVPAEKWNIQTEDGETPDTLSEDVLYEVHMTVEDVNDCLLQYFYFDRVYLLRSDNRYRHNTAPYPAL